MKKKAKKKAAAYQYPTSKELREGTVIAKIFTDLKGQKKIPKAVLKKKYGKEVNVDARLAQLAARGKRNGAWALLRDEDTVQLKIKDKSLLKAA